MRGLIVVLWRAGLRIGEALDLHEGDLEPARGALLVREGRGGGRREVGMDDWGLEATAALAGPPQEERQRDRVEKHVLDVAEVGIALIVVDQLRWSGFADWRVGLALGLFRGRVLREHRGGSKDRRAAGGTPPAGRASTVRPRARGPPARQRRAVTASRRRPRASRRIPPSWRWRCDCRCPRGLPRARCGASPLWLRCQTRHAQPHLGESRCPGSPSVGSHPEACTRRRSGRPRPFARQSRG